MAEYRAALDAIGAPWRFGTDRPEDRCGWTARTVVQPGEPGADGRTLPYPVVPRDVEVPGLPRILFAVGERAGA